MVQTKEIFHQSINDLDRTDEYTEDMRNPSFSGSNIVDDHHDEKQGNTSGTLASPVVGSYPEGGLVAWATVTGALIVQFCTFGYANAFGVYQDFYTRQYLSDHSSSEIGWIGSVQLMLMLSADLISGRIFDRGYGHHVIIFGCTLFVFSLFMLSLTKPNQYYQIFLSHGLGVGLGAGLAFTPSMSIVAHHFQRRRTLAMAIAASGSSLGGVLHPIMLNNLIHGSAGFAKGVRASAGMCLALLIVANLMMRKRLPAIEPVKLSSVIKKFATDVGYICATIGTMFVIMGFFFPVFYLQLDSIKHGLDPTFAFYSLSILNGLSVVGRVVPGFFARSFGIFRMMVSFALGSSVLIFSMLAVKDVVGVTFFAVFYGFFSGAYVTLLAPILAVFADDVHEVGARMGIGFTFTGLGALFGSPIQGALLTGQFIWWRPAVFSGVVVALGALFLSIAGLLHARRQEHKERIGSKA